MEVAIDLIANKCCTGFVKPTRASALAMDHRWRPKSLLCSILWFVLSAIVRSRLDDSKPSVQLHGKGGYLS